MTLSELRPDNIITIGTLPCKVVSVDVDMRLVTVARGGLTATMELEYFAPLRITSRSLILSLHFKADGLSDTLSLYTKETQSYTAAIVQTIHRNWLLAITDTATHDTVHLPVSFIHEVQNAIMDWG